MFTWVELYAVQAIYCIHVFEKELSSFIGEMEFTASE